MVKGFNNSITRRHHKNRFKLGGMEGKHLLPLSYKDAGYKKQAIVRKKKNR